jgi:hypothetical protein
MAYEWVHEINHKTDILKYSKYYDKLLQRDNTGCSGIYYKRLYNEFKEPYLRELSERIKYCQMRMEEEEKQKFLIKKKSQKNNGNKNGIK